jgi:outer membrane murein-binding lipoprotein Lpp
MTQLQQEGRILSLAAMMDTKLPDFNEEYRKLKEKLTLFDEVIEREKQLEVENGHLAETKVAIQGLCSDVEQLGVDVKDLREDLKVWEADHERKKAKWNEEKGGDQELVFNSDAPHQNLEQLKATAELAQLNGLLFEQKLCIEELSKSIETKEAELKKKSSDLNTKIELILVLERDVSVKKAASNAAKLTWERHVRTSIQISKFLGQTAISNIAIVTKLQSELEMKEKTIKSLEEKSATLTKNLQPLIEAGCQIRSRKLEWEKINSSRDAIAQGNAASYLSMALADASLYQNFQSFTQEFSPNNQSFVSLYGLDPHFVWKFQDCKKFIDFVNWCADLKYFQAFSTGQGKFPSTRAQRWASRILDDMTHNPRSFTAHVLNNFFDSEHLVKEFYEELKNEHAVALNKHKQSIHVG